MAQEATVEAIVDAALLRIEIAESASTRGGAEALVSELYAASLPLLKERLCIIVADFALNNGGANRSVLLECGAVEALLHTLRCSNGSLATITAVFVAVSILAALITDWRDDVVCVVAQEAIKTLRGPLASELLLSQAVCAFLCNATTHPSVLPLMCNVDIATLLVTIMQRFPTCELYLEYRSDDEVR